jgi:uncharacterized tellurite resistance protein B-like protein
MNFLDVRYRFDDPAQHGLGGSLRSASPASERTRSHLLASAVKITPGLFPVLAEGLRNLSASMMLREEVDCFVVADPEMQAYCIPHQSDEFERFTVVISSALVERLRIDEIRFVIGHEIGHFLCGHWRYPNTNENGCLGDRLATLRLMRAAEISADRIGMLACGSLEHACAAMIKVAAGLGYPHLQPDIPSIMLQFRELARGEGTESAIWTTHPIIPMRVRALLRFEPICRAIRQDAVYNEEELVKVDDAIEIDFHKTSGFALQKISDKHLELARVWGLVSLFAADGVISKSEQHLMLEILGKEITTKVLNFLKAQSSGLSDAVDLRLVQACEIARLAPLKDRKAMLHEFSELIAETGDADPAIRQVFLRIQSLLES